MPLLCAFGLIVVTVILHASGTLEEITHLTRVWRRQEANQGSLASTLQTVRVVCVLLVLHFFEAGAWAMFFLIAGLLPDLGTAVYFSLTSYTTVGYGDIVLPVPWRILGPIEAAVGILMFGWSTAIMVAVITRIYASRLRIPVEAPDEDNGHLFG
jgi:voltage-gated potassium channel Kch